MGIMVDLSDKRALTDSVLFWLAGTLALVGTAILLLASSDTPSRFILNGEVVEVKGSQAVVQANVSVTARNLNVGDRFESAVFWSEDRFVAVNE